MTPHLSRRFGNAFQVGGGGVDIVNIITGTNFIKVEVQYESASAPIEGEINIVPQGNGTIQTRHVSLPQEGGIVEEEFGVFVPEGETEDFVVTALRLQPEQAQDQETTTVRGDSAFNKWLPVFIALAGAFVIITLDDEDELI